MELAPGVHAIESDLGVRSMSQFLLEGSERAVLVDTGLAGTPASAILPYLRDRGVDVELAVISHADVDHCGGNRALREARPGIRFAAHEADRAWIESNDAMLAGNYLWYREHGFGPDDETAAFLREQLGGDAPVDTTLAAGDVLALGDGVAFEVLHLPGHTPGHIGLWDGERGIAVIVDAILERGVADREGRLLIPPRIYDVAAYRDTVRRVRELEPSLLLTAHFPVMDAGAARAFCDRSLAFMDDVEEAVAAVRQEGAEDLWDVTRAVDARLGPYPEFMFELAAAVRWHLAAPAA